MTLARFAIPALVVAIGGCALPNPPYDGNTRTTLLLGPDAGAFTAFVFPRTAPESVAVEAAREAALKACRATYRRNAVRITATKDGSFAVPYEWRIDGVCA